jgi:type IV pilus assembly protein PilQ
VAAATDRNASAPAVERSQPQAASQVASNEGAAAVPAPAPANDNAAATPQPAPANYATPASAPATAPAASRTGERPLDVSGTMFAPAQSDAAAPTAALPQLQPEDFETKTIQDQRRTYTGKAISLNLVDADIRQVFSVFHDLSGLNFVLDPAVSGAVTIVVDEVPWDQALDLILQNNGLEMALEGNVIRIAPVVKLAQEAAARRQLREAKDLEANPVTITRTLSYAKASDVDKVIRDAILSTKGRVIIDDRTNTLIIRDIPDRVDAIDKLLTTLDAETPQVMIEARIVEVSRDYSYDLGIKWGATATADPAIGTGIGTQFPHKATGDWSLNLPRNPSASALSFSFGNVLDSFNLDITLDALETEGYAKRLSAPKIATQNNEPAEIEQGVRFPIVNTTATEIKTEFVSASLRMKVTPQITAEGTVILDVEVANDSPDFVDRSQDTVPAVNTQRATTKVLIADGGTTVIGGIYTVNEGRSTKGVPWFSKLPGLGWLFRSKSITNKNRELLIFITPRIIKAA